MSNTAGLGLKSSSSSRRKSIPDSGGSGSRAPAIVENLLIDLGKDQKSKLRDTLRKQVSVNGRDRTKHESASTAASNRRLTVNSVFNHYCRGYLPPGQTFEYIEKKAQVMDLKHFYDFMKDFGLFPGCFSSRHEVTLLFQKLNLMSKKKESRVELGRAQFETFIQGVLDLKAPAHQRGMTSEDALNTWRRGKLSGDFSYWNEIMKPMTFDDMDKLEAITESLGDDIHDHDDDDDDTHDIDGAVRQEIGVRNEQIRELIELICGHEHIPSLPFLKESGISLPSQPTHIQRLRIERDQIQECITWVADHINDLHHDQIDRSTLQTIQHQHSRLIQEFSNIIIQKYDLQHNYHQIIEQMELYEKHFQQIQLLSNNHHYLLQHHLDAERDRSCQLQNANNVLENHLHDKQQELDRLRYEYEQKMSIIRSELEAATSASMKTRSDLESECHRNRILQQQIDHERSERQHLSTQLSSVMEQIERDHDDLVQRQNAINDTVVQELHQAREHETDRTRYLNDSMKTLLEKFQEIQTESLRYLDLYMEERQQCLTLKAQLLQINTCLETSQTQSASLLTSLNNKVQECSGLEQQLQDLQQERDRLMEINQHYVANLKSASESLTRVQSEQCELQQSLESKIAEMQLLSHERESAIADLYLTKSQLTNATEKSQHLQELYDREQQRFLQVQHDYQCTQHKITEHESQLNESRQANALLSATVCNLESRLDHVIDDIKLQVEDAICSNTRANSDIEHINRALLDKQNEYLMAQAETQLMSQRLSALAEAAEQREQNLLEKVAVWEATSACLNRVLDRNADRYHHLQDDLRTERQQTDLWHKRASQLNIVLDQIRAMAHIIPKYNE